MNLAVPRQVDWTAAAFAAGLAYACFLAAMFLSHLWLSDASGAILANDFAVFSAGKLAHVGHSALAYDGPAHHAAETAWVGHSFPHDYPWSYPPTFLFVAVPLSHLPYVDAFFLWILFTLPLYAIMVARIAQRREAVLWAFAFPAVLFNAYVGQNGCLSAALIGGALLLMEDRPLLSGICIGLLTFKPQFGILLPFVLLASGQWRVIASASGTALLLGVASLLVFGAESWIAFVHSLPLTAHIILETGQTGWNKLQTVYGFARWIGASDSAAWSAQMFMAGLMVLGLVLMWRSRLPFALKAAGLCVGILLVTPYAYIYDFPILAVGIAFLYRHRGFSRYEAGVLLAACLLILIFPWAKAPLGLASTLLVASLVSRRARRIAYPQTDVALQCA